MTGRAVRERVREKRRCIEINKKEKMNMKRGRQREHFRYVDKERSWRDINSNRD